MCVIYVHLEHVFRSYIIINFFFVILIFFFTTCICLNNVIFTYMTLYTNSACENLEYPDIKLDKCTDFFKVLKLEKN